VRKEVVAANVSKRNLRQARRLDLLGCGVQSWAGTANIVRSRGLVVVSGVTISGYLVSTDALSGYTILGTVVRVLCVVGSGTLVVGIEWASGGTTLLVATRLLTSDLASSSEKRAVDTRLINDPWEG